MDAQTLVESWHFYEEMAKRREYGEIVSSDGKIILSPALGHWFSWLGYGVVGW